MNSSELFIVILNWNGWNDTKECLESVYNSSFSNFTVVLVDNGSEHDYSEIKQWSEKNIDSFLEAPADNISSLQIAAALSIGKRLIFLKSNENLGFAKANNIGIRLAKRHNIPFVFLLNNDTVVPADTIKKLMNFIEENNNYTAIVPQIRYYEPKDMIWCCGGWLNGFYEAYYYKGEMHNNLNLHGHKKISFATGCALLIRNNEFDLLSEKFFFGEEDFELSLRFKKLGKKMACVLDAIVYHKESASIDRSSRHINKIFIHRLNRFINIKTYAPCTWFFIISYRSFKFFLMHLLIEKTGFLKAVKNALMLFEMASKLNEVNKQTFEHILKLQLK